MIIVKIKGGLGNQLFQYATGRALSMKYNTELKVDLSFFENPKYNNVFRLNRFNLPLTIVKTDEYKHLLNKESRTIFSRIIKRLGLRIQPYFKDTHVIETEVLKLLNGYKNKSSNYYVEGWLADENYFNDYRKIVLKDFNADNILNNDNLSLMEEIRRTNSVAVHIRRGDYLTNNYFNNLPVLYYQKAIDLLSKKICNPLFYFFSNDIDWVKEEFSSLTNAIFVDKNSEIESVYTTIGDIEDLMLMRSCHHQIIANSTFSWWGAWLNENPDKIVIAPQKWFADFKAQNNYEKGNFIPQNWVKI
jgi:Glycosyl transferase family 11.